MPTLSELRLELASRTIQWITHIVVLILSIVLIVMISIDTVHNITFYTLESFRKWEFWICIAFMLAFFIEWVIAPRKLHYLLTHFVFLLVSIPYQEIMVHLGWNVPEKIWYLIRYMPLIRGGYAMAYVVSWFASNRVTGLFLAYIVTMLSTVYFSSLTFYLFEMHVNPQVKEYVDALWWACMAVTTEGSNITAMTGVGRVLSVLLAGMGIVMFPVFTVYVTNLMQSRQRQGSARAKFMSAYDQMENIKDGNSSKQK